MSQASFDPQALLADWPVLFPPGISEAALEPLMARVSSYRLQAGVLRVLAALDEVEAPMPGGARFKVRRETSVFDDTYNYLIHVHDVSLNDPASGEAYRAKVVSARSVLYEALNEASSLDDNASSFVYGWVERLNKTQWRVDARERVLIEALATVGIDGQTFLAQAREHALSQGTPSLPPSAAPKQRL